MSNSHNTKQRSHPSKKHKPINRTATRKPLACNDISSSEYVDDEGRAVMAALEWMTLTADDKEDLVGVGVATEAAYIDVRVGLKHKSHKDFFDWAQTVYVGHAHDESELEHYFDMSIQALSIAVRMEKYRTGIDLLAVAKSQTRFRTILTTIRSKELPSGAKYYWAPYEIGTFEHMMWLIAFSKNYERPWLGMPFDE